MHYAETGKNIKFLMSIGLFQKRKPQAISITWGSTLNLASTYSPMQLPA